MKISIIIPVFSGEDTIELLFDGISHSLASLGSFEVIFIYDRGPDNSWEILQILKKRHPSEIRIFKLKKNYGQHNAILFGFSVAHGDLIITMDEDLQHDPRYLVSLLEKQREFDYDVVYARFCDPKHPFFRKIASAILQKSLKFLIPGLGYYSSYRIIKKDIAQKIVLLKNSYTFIDANLIKVTSNIGFLDIDHRGNTIRKTSYNFMRLTSHAVQIVLAYTRITNWLYFSSILLLLLDGISLISGFLDKHTQIWIIAGALLILILAISADFYHRWEIKNNLLPTISIENE